MIFMTKLLIAALMIFIYLLSGFSFSFAAPQIFEADGSCIMGDTGVENVAVAEDTARANARRAASEKAGVFVYSMSETENGVLTKDQVTILSASLLKVESSNIEMELVSAVNNTMMKNTAPTINPANPIWSNTLGNATNISPGPAVAFIWSAPINATTAGIIITPAKNATKVSKISILLTELTRLSLSLR